MSLLGAYCPSRSIHVFEEIKYQRQHIDPVVLKEQSQSLSHSPFNTLTTLTTPTKPIQRSVGLYFYRRGLKAGFHGSPTLINFTRTERIPGW